MLPPAACTLRLAARVQVSRARPWDLNDSLTSFLLLAGAVGLPLALAAQGISPTAREWHVAGPPAVAMTLGAVLMAVGAFRMPAKDLISLGVRPPLA